jgi:hypothetical protein
MMIIISPEEEPAMELKAGLKENGISILLL